MFPKGTQEAVSVQVLLSSVVLAVDVALQALEALVVRLAEVPLVEAEAAEDFRIFF